MLRFLLIALLLLPTMSIAELRLNSDLDNLFDADIEQLALVNGELEQLTTFEQLTDRQWIPLLPNNGNLGIVHGTRWLKINVYNPTDTENWLLQLNNRGLNVVEGWVSTSQGLQNFRIGALLPLKEGRDIAMPRLNAKVALPANSHAQIFLRLTHNGFADLNGKLTTMEVALEGRLHESATEITFYGVLMTLFLYHLVLLVGTRNTSYIGYCLFVLSTVCFFSFTEGYLWFMLPNHPNAVYAIGQGSIGLVSASAALFSLLYLNLRQFPIARYGLNLTMVLGILIFLFRLIYWNYPVLVFGGLLAAAVFLVIPIISLIRYIKFHDKLALVYFYSWALWSVLAFIVVLTLFNVLPIDLSAFWPILKAAFAIQSFVLAWSLGFRIRSLQQQRTRALAESDAKTDLLTRVSHEIRTPMNGIIGTSQLLESHLTTAEAHKLNDTIFHSGLSLLTIINDLLDLSRLENSSVKITPEPTPIKTLIHQVELTLQAQLKQKSLTLITDISERTPDTLLIDGPRLRQVLFNIVGNAIKYTAQGSIEIAVDFEPGKMSVIVKDTGRGIPSEKLESIFAPFVQVRDTAREMRTGTGLGLHIARSLIELMGGKIILNSQENVGTEVKICLPASATEMSQPTRMSVNATDHSLKVLVVDDNDVNLTVIAGLFKKLGHQCQSAKNGMEAVNIYFENHEDIDCIFMDCEMPVMDGYAASLKIREIELAKHLPAKPIIAVTAHAYAGHQEKIEAAGMDDQVSKPITRESIAMALNQLYHHQPIASS